MDTSSGVFDNNGGADYALPLVGAPTEQQVLERRAAAFEAAEKERLAVRDLSFSWNVICFGGKWRAPSVVSCCR